MSYFLGFDGGGTKTECVVLDSQGLVAGVGRGGPANPLRCGYEAAFQSLVDASSAALGKASLTPANIAGVCAGLAGAGRRTVVRRMLVFLAEQFPGAIAQVATDNEIALEAATGAGPGVVLISGTGSIAYGRNAAGETARAGGYGPWIGDEGSAFDIGRRAIGASLRARDEAVGLPLLGEMILAGLVCRDWDEVLELTLKSPDEIFPKLFPVVVAAADQGDMSAREILFTSAIGLGNLAMMVIRRLGMRELQFPVVKCGGVFGHSEILDTLLDSVLASGALNATLSTLEVSPAVGAARMASRLGNSPHQAVRHGA